MLRLSTSFVTKGAMTVKRPYHRGNLKQSLLDAAVALVGEVGPEAFTLREVARRAGVSHNAPYRHFESKDDLVEAVATEGFRELTEAMRKSSALPSKARDRLTAAGLAYVSFALRRQDHFAVMFDTGRRPQPSAEY